MGLPQQGSSRRAAPHGCWAWGPNWKSSEKIKKEEPQYAHAGIVPVYMQMHMLSSARTCALHIQSATTLHVYLYLCVCFSVGKERLDGGHEEG